MLLRHIQEFITALLFLCNYIGTVRTTESPSPGRNKGPLKPEDQRKEKSHSVTGNMSPPIMMYGNMLAWEQTDITQSDPAIKDIIKIAIDFVKSQKEEAETKSTELYNEHTIEDLKKYKLVYSQDDVSPFSLLTDGGDDAKEVCPQQTGEEANLAYMGYFYKFTLKLGTDKHKFEMSEFIPGDTHIYSHIVDGGDHVSCNTQSDDSSQSHMTASTDCEVDEPVSPCKKVCTEKPKLKILTQNIWNFFNIEHTEEDYVRRMKILGPVLKSAAADIIGFQEIRYQHGSGLELGPNQMSHLYKYLPDYQFVFQPAMTQSRSVKEGRCEEGLAIFSRYPIVSHDFILLHRNKSNPADGHQRICLHAEIDVPSFGKVHVFVAHLSLEDRARQTSVVEIYKYMQQFDGPSFFMGDLNAEPYEEPIKYLNGEVELDGSVVTDLVDTWLVSHEEGPEGLTFSALETKPDKRIDYIYMRKSERLHVDKVELVNSGNYGSDAASDHYGVLATFTKEK